MLHLVIFVQACLRVSWILSAGLDVLNHAKAQTLVEGIIDGLGIAALVVCYLLCILLWMQVLNQISPSGEKRNLCIKHRNLVILSLVVMYVGVEIGLRVVWNLSDSPKFIYIAISIYNVIVLLATLACSVVFVYFSVLLYRVLRESARGPASVERMTTMMAFTTFTLVISIITLLLSIVFFGVEVFRFRWKNWNAWLIEQVLLRSLEAGYSIGTLWFLRNIPPHEIIPEVSRTHMFQL
jgi:hypothetical protein